MGQPPDVARRPGTWSGYAAAGWAVAFGGLSFYWAAGGHVGLGTLAETIREKALARDEAFIRLIWVTGGLKMVLALLPLSLVRHWHVLPERLVRAAAWICAAALSVYGAMGIVSGLLTELGLSHPEDASGARWYSFLWGPVWLTGGLFIFGSVWLTRDVPTAAPGHENRCRCDVSDPPEEDRGT